MGNFQDHMRYGVGSYVTVFGCLFALPFVIGGAAFPDIDHHASKPHKWLRSGVFVSTTLISAFLFVSEGSFYSLTLAEGVKTASGAPLSDGALSLIIIGVGALIVGVVAEYAVGFFKPVHRGVTHTLTTGGLVSAILGGAVALGLTLVFPDVSLLLGAVAGMSFFIGFLSHLQCDGLFFRYLPEC